MRHCLPLLPHRFDLSTIAVNFSPLQIPSMRSAPSTSVRMPNSSPNFSKAARCRVRRRSTAKGRQVTFMPPRPGRHDPRRACPKACRAAPMPRHLDSGLGHGGSSRGRRHAITRCWRQSRYPSPSFRCEFRPWPRSKKPRRADRPKTGRHRPYIETRRARNLPARESGDRVSARDPGRGRGVARSQARPPGYWRGGFARGRVRWRAPIFQCSGAVNRNRYQRPL
jgi:hypothetical protein